MIDVKVQEDPLDYHVESRKNFSEFQAFHQAVSISISVDHVADDSKVQDALVCQDAQELLLSQREGAGFDGAGFVAAMRPDYKSFISVQGFAQEPSEHSLPISLRECKTSQPA